ncbi:MAG: hypothetical protein NVS3B25_19160 [Hymenobacter sp.]
MSYEESLNPTGYPLPLSDDPVNPAHYHGKEVFNQMLATFGKADMQVFCKLNAYKYLVRSGKKAGNPEAQDVAKGNWYLTELLALLRSK